jgi:hypothetical protein
LARNDAASQIIEEKAMKALRKNILIEHRPQVKPRRRTITAEESIERMKNIDEWRKKNLATFRKTKAIPH